MDNLSIVIRDAEDKIYECLENLKPLLEESKVQLVLINNEIEKFDIPYEYTHYEFRESYNKFSDFYESICLHNSKLLIEKGMSINAEFVKSIKQCIENNKNLKLKIRKFISHNKTEYLISDVMLVLNDGLNSIENLDEVILEDYSMISFDMEDIEVNLYKLLKGKSYEEIYNWYDACIRQRNNCYEQKFFEVLENLKHDFNIEEEKVSEIFVLNDTDEKYKNYLTIMSLYQEKPNKFIEKIKNLLLNNDFQQQDVYFSNFIVKLFKDKNFCLELLENINASSLNAYLKYLLEKNKTFYIDIYNFMMWIDLGKETSIKNNDKVPLLLNVLKSYINYMDDKSANFEKKDILIQMFLEYTNYGFYYFNNNLLGNEELNLNDETKFLIDMDKVVDCLNKNFVSEAIDILKKASEEYKLMTMTIRYYIQRLIRSNNLYPYKLSICIMAKNEEKFLNKCLSSIKPLLDSEIAELIFVDTGSTDSTIEIARNYTDRIYHKPWQGNFSKMRNYCVSLAQGEYIFIPDADEELQDGEAEKLIKLFNSEEYKKYNTFTFKEKNFTDEEYKNYSMFTRTFIFRNREDFYYYGSVHNQPNKLKPINNLDTVILHYGYIMTEDVKHKKFERTAKLLKNELQNNPSDLYYRMQLSTSYSMHGDNKKALEQVELYIKLLKDRELTKGLSLMACNNAVIIYGSNGLYKKIIEICDRALKVEPTFIDFVYNKAMAYFALRKYCEAINYYLHYLELINNTERLDILNDDRYIFYSLGLENEALGKLLICYYEIEDYDNFNKIVYEIKDDILLKYCIYTILSFYIENKKYIDLTEFFRKKIMFSNDFDIKYIFNYFITEIINECSEEEKQNIIKQFSNINESNEYLEVVKSLLNSKGDSIAILEFINRYDLRKLDLISAKMILDKIYPFLIKDNYIDSFKLEEIKSLKDGALFLLNNTVNSKILTGLSKENLLTIINNYIEICDRLINKKRCDLLSKKEIEFCKIIKLAKENFRNNNLTSGLRNVRDAVVIHEEMARPMQLYLEKVIPGYNAELEYFNNSNGEKNMNNELIEYCNKIKSQVEQLINNKSLDQANLLIEEYENIIKEDLDIWSMKAVIEIMKNNLDEAEIILKKSLQIDKNSFDINYNLGYLYQLKGNNNVAAKYYKIACDITDDNSILQQLNDTINSLSSYDSIENDVKIYIEQGNYSEVINDLNNKVISRDYNKVISVCDYWLENVSKDTAIIYYFKALASNGLREFDDALFYHKKALELDNSFADMRNKKSKYIYDYSEKEINCIGCGSNEYEIIWIGNQSISEDNKELINPIRRWVQCKKCGLIYVNPQPEEDVLNKYYSIIAKEKFGGIYGNIDDRFNFLVDLANDRLSKIESYNKGEKTLLDIGAGVGTFVGTALDRGWDATGLELTPEDCEYAKNKYGIEHLQQNFYSFTDNQKYDVVTLFEVIEHLQNPLKDLKRINGLIKQNGLLVVATPIVNTLYGKKMKEHNIFWNVVTHLSYFSREVMIEYLNQSGFEVIETNMSKEQMGRVEFYCRKIREI